MFWKNVIFKAVLVTVFAVLISNGLFLLLGHTTTFVREAVKAGIFFVFILLYTYYQEKKKVDAGASGTNDSEQV